MRKLYLPMAALLCFTAVCTFSCKNQSETNTTVKELAEEQEGGESDEGYDGPLERDLLEFEKTKDPALNRVPYERMYNAIKYAETLKDQNGFSLFSGIWTERGPDFDSVGPSNGNGRGGTGSNRNVGGYTAGRIRGVLVDASDPTGNTVWVGGVAGGLWKTTNLLSNSYTWQAINDNFENMAISSICQDPTNPDVMYFSTGEPTSNADAVIGLGVFKSIDHGVTWNRLTNTATLQRCFKIDCDAEGNVYLATRTAGSYLVRSNNGGGTWTNIAPVSSICTDFEFSAGGRMHGSFGYSGGTTQIRYVNNPGTATTANWLTPTGITTTANRIELGVKGDTIQAGIINTSNNLTQSYRSFDGGQTYTLNNTTAYTTALSNTQGWYDVTFVVDPNDATKMIGAGVDAYRSSDTGKTVQRLTYWVSTTPYVHADHHFLKWWNIGGETRMLIGCDGGLFLSRDNGSTWDDKNKGLNIKQFYSVAVHPTETNTFLAGAQDNGTHQLKQAGLSYSIEVTGGDGAYVHIDQVNPQFQFGAYVYNQYRRSIDNGASWTSFNLSSTTGRFINPFDFDNTLKVLYGGYGAGQMLRWNNPTTATSTANALRDVVNTDAVTGTSLGSPSAFQVSPNTPNRLFVGTGSGRVVRIENASTTTGTAAGDVTNISGPSFSGYVSCVAVGNTDNNLLATISSYGVTQVWLSNDAGASWVSADGNLPDMPVRWAVFNPTNNDQAIIATEAGVWVTMNLNGSSTSWFPSPGFPTVRTDMLRLRPTDGLLAAGTHGRGIFTTTLSQALPVRDVKLSGNLTGDGLSLLNWTSHDETKNTKFVVQYSLDGINFSKVGEVPYTVKQYRHSFSAPVGYYRIMAAEPGQSPIFSNIVSLRNTGKVKGLEVRISPNPITGNAANATISSSTAGNFTWNFFDMGGKMLQTGNGNLPAGGSQNIVLNTAGLPAGMYQLKLVQGGSTSVVAVIKQ